jgi:hypothetical protein
MECPAVRDVLAEFALGTLPPDRRAEVERHLAWCAGCRKEAGRLGEGAAAAAMALPDVDPPPNLEGRVVAAVSAGARRSRRPRGAVVAATVAAVVAVGSMAWAASMVGRIDRLENEQAGLDVGRIEQVVRELGGRDVRSTDLVAVGAGGEGRALVYDGSSDWVLVVASGLPEGRYRAYLSMSGGRMDIGRMWPQGAGELAVVRIFPADISAFDGVLVATSDGEVVLRGTLGSQD